MSNIAFLYPAIIDYKLTLEGILDIFGDIFNIENIKIASEIRDIRVFNSKPGSIIQYKNVNEIINKGYTVIIDSLKNYIDSGNKISLNAGYVIMIDPYLDESYYLFIQTFTFYRCNLYFLEPEPIIHLVDWTDLEFELFKIASDECIVCDSDKNDSITKHTKYIIGNNIMNYLKKIIRTVSGVTIYTRDKDIYNKYIHRKKYFDSAKLISFDKSRLILE